MDRDRPVAPGPTLEEHRAVWDLALDLLSVASPDGYFVHLSPSWTRVLGWSVEELTSRPFIEFVHPDDVERTIEALGAVSAPGAEVHGFENRYRTRDGGVRWLSWDARADDDGRLIYSVAVDVTARREAEAGRRASERRFELAAEHAPIGMALVGLDGSWVMVNPAYQRLLGYTAEELTAGLTFQDITHPDDLDDDVHLVEQLLAGELEDYTLEKRYIRKDGSLVWVLLAVSLVRDEHGQPEVFIAQAADITARKRQEHALQQLVDELEGSQQEMEHFVGAASHDIASPLGLIASYLEMLASTEELSPSAAELVARAQALSLRSVSLVRGILKFATASKDETPAETVNADETLASVLDVLSEEIDSAGATVETSPLPRVQADPAAMSSLLQNLIVNALRYGGDGPRVRVHASRLGDEVALMVDDDGPGIAEHERLRVLQPFERGQASIGREGSGLGLATCRRIAERLGGSLDIGDSPEGGARVTVRLPAAFVSLAPTDPRS